MAGPHRGAPEARRTPVPTSIGLAAAVVLAVGIAPAFADQGQSTAPNMRFTEIPGVVAHSSHYTGPARISPASKGTWYYSEDLEQYAFPPHYNTHLYGTESSPGTWLFPPTPTRARAARAQSLKREGRHFCRPLPFNTSRLKD